MLKGYYLSPDGHKVNLIGYDFDNYITLIASCSSIKDKRFLDRGVVTEGGTEYYPWEELYVQVNTGDIKVDDLRVEGEKTNFNAEAFTRIGSIIRGMKSICIPQREEDFYNINNMESFGSKSVYTYNYFGQEITLVENQIDKLSYSNGDEMLILEDVYSEPVPMSKNTSTQRKYGLDLTEFSRTDDLSVDGMDFFLSKDIGSDDVYSLAEIVERNPDKSYAWLKDRFYHIVNDLELWKKISKRIWKHPDVVAFDTETTGLNITFKSITGQGDQLVGLVFSIESTASEKEKIKLKNLFGDPLYGDSWYIPIKHKNIKNIVPQQEVNKFIEVYVKPLLEKKEIVCHNGSFDAKVMFIYGVRINLVHDTLIQLRLSYGAENTLMKLGLKPNAKRFLGRDSFELSDFVEGKWGSGDVTFADLPYESVKYYACPDTDSTLALHKLAVKENWFDKWGMRRVYELEVAFTLVIAYQEFFGHHVAVSKIAKLRKQLQEDATKYSNKIFEIAGYSLNLRSPAQLKKLFFEELGMPILEYTNSGAPSTSKDAMKKYLSYKDENGKLMYPIADYLLKYRDAAKLLSDFIKNIDTISTPDGFMFSRVKQFLETGRLSVSNPNYQSYNDTVKKYIAPRKGYYMMDSDYSSVEIRIMMSMAQEKPMIEYLFDPDSDYHTLKASQMFSIPYELVSKKQRGAAKGVNFGIVYGMGDASLGENVTGKRSAESTRYGGQLRKLYFKGMDVTEDFIAKNLEKAVENRYAETFFGRRRYFPPTMRIGSVKRQGGNHPIQGTAADLYKQAMVNLYGAIIKKGWWGKFLLPCFVHDEIVMEAHNSINPAHALKLVQDSLMLDIEGWCPLYIGFGYGSHWYNAKKTEVPVQLQQEFVDKYGESGFPFWDGNIHNLYAWEVKEIYNYWVNRIKGYMKDPKNIGTVISPVISGFLFEVMPYVSSLGKLKQKASELLEFAKELSKMPRDLSNDSFYNAEDKFTKLIDDYESLQNCGVHLDKHTEKFSKFFDDLSISVGEKDEVVGYEVPVYRNLFDGLLRDEEKVRKTLSYIITVCEEVLEEEFLPNLKTTEVELGGIKENLIAFGKAFGCEDLVEKANLQEPHSVEVEERAVEETYEPQLDDVPKEELMKEYLDGFGYYRDYDERTLYFDGTNDALLNYMVGYLQKNGVLAKRDGDAYVKAKNSFESGSAEYTLVKFVITKDGDLHKASLYLPSAQASRSCTMCLKVKRQIGA